MTIGCDKSNVLEIERPQSIPNRDPSPAISDQEDLQTIFTPAGIMDPNSKILKEHVKLTDGKPLSQRLRRPSLIEKPFVAREPLFVEDTGEILVHQSNRVFVDLCHEHKLKTAWRTRQVEKCPHEIPSLLPAPNQTMKHAGEEYEIEPVQ